MPEYTFQDNMAYTGVAADNPPNVLNFKAAPTVNDRKPVNTIANVPSTLEAYYLVGYDAGEPVWLTLASEAEGLQTVTTPSGTATVSADNLDFASGGGVDISATGDTVTFSATGGGMAWNEETGTSATIAVHNAYVANNGSLVTFTLPATAAVGDVFAIVGKGAGGWSIAQNAGQTIHSNLSSTTTGVAGSLSSSGQRDAVYVVCTTANTDFTVMAGVSGGYVIV